MQVQKKSVNDLVHHFEVVCPLDTWTAYRESELKKRAAKFKMDGFRPGKVPLDIAKRYIEPEINQHFENHIMRIISKDLQEHTKDLDVINTIVTLSEPKENSVEAKIDVHTMPTLDWEKIKTLKIEDITIEPSQKFIDEFKKMINDMVPVFQEPDAKKTIEAEDQITVDISTYKDGKEIRSERKVNHTLIIPTKEKLAEQDDAQLTKKILGKCAGDVIRTQEHISKKHPNKKLANQLVEVELRIQSVAARKTNPTDTEIAKCLGFSDFDELKSKIIERIQLFSEKLIQAHQRRKIFDAIYETYEFSTPEHLVENEYERIRQTLDQANNQEEDISTEECKSIAKRRVCLKWIVQMFDKKHPSNLKETDIDPIVNNMASDLGTHPSRIWPALMKAQKNPNNEQSKNLLRIFHSHQIEYSMVQHVLSNAQKTARNVAQDDVEVFFSETVSTDLLNPIANPYFFMISFFAQSHAQNNG